MATIAKGSITLVNVNDAYSVLSTPDSCVINAAFDGTSPNLDAAFTDITVVRGETKHTYKIELSKMSSSKITYQLSSIDAYTKRIKLTSIPSDALSGYVTFTVTTDDEYIADVTFQYSVVRETSMLDWILDWESNKTVIGDTYLITPKIFVGKKVENEAGMATLTGVYIGPDDVNTAGIYGYKEGKDVFHINVNGAMIGGWDINSDGITTSNEYGSLQILSEGTLQFLNTKGDAIWKIWKDGSAEFSQGNVCFYENGNAYFAGEISADLGQIGGWKILTNSLFSSNIILDSAKHLIGICGTNATDEIFMIEDIAAEIQQNGGVYLYYNNIADYGLRGYMPQHNEDDVDKPTLGFSLGSTNQIANWCFDDTALYMGTKNNMSSQYTDEVGSITIGSNGMRGYGWYIDSDGNISFVSGGIQFTKDGGVIVGWDLHQNRLSTDYVAIVSDSNDAGIYMSVAGGFHTLSSSSMADHIASNGGIYMKVKPDDVSFAAYYSDGGKIFELRSNGVSSIAEWNIESDALFVGTKSTSSGTFTSEAGSITISSTGIRGNKWRLEADGSGSLAGDSISWNADGEIDFKAKVSADNITAGTISACTIQSSIENPAWQLAQDGSGYLAGGNISWKTDGSLSINGEIEASSGHIGGLKINSNSLGLSSYNSGDGMFLSSNIICFNKGKRIAMFGCCDTIFALPVACRITDDVYDSSHIPRTGLYVAVTGSLYDNVAIEMGGGYISGLNYKVKLIGFDRITATEAGGKPPTQHNVSIDRTIVCIHVSTLIYWREYGDRDDDSKFVEKSRIVNITFPDMKHCDDGHVLMIKRGIENNGIVYLIPGTAHYKKQNLSGGYTEETGKTCFLVDSCTYVTDKMAVQSEGDAMQFVYFRDWTHTENNIEYRGVWVQWKNPRTW